MEIGDTSTLAPLPLSARGVGGGGGWMGPSLSSVLANPRAGLGDKGQPLHMTTYLPSQAQQSLNFTSLMVTAFQIAVTDSLLIPFFLLPPQLGDPGVLLPLEARDDGIIGRKLSLIVSPLSWSLPGASGCPSGDSDRGLTNLRFSLQPRRPNTSSRVGESRKQNENPEPVSSQ
jgi:hypothetical protein